MTGRFDLHNDVCPYCASCTACSAYPCRGYAVCAREECQTEKRRADALQRLTEPVPSGPAFGFADDAGTGFYNPNAASIGIAVGGVLVATLKLPK